MCAARRPRTADVSARSHALRRAPRDRRIDAGQLLDLLRPTQNLVDRNEAGRRDAKREQQYQTEAADKLLATERLVNRFCTGSIRKVPQKGTLGKSAEITNS